MKTFLITFDTDKTTTQTTNMNLTKKFLNDYWPLICAIKEGKSLQFSSNGENDWKDFEKNDNPSFCFAPCHYRVKPEPKLRAWKVSEVPVGALLKVNDVIVTILGVDPQYSCIRHPAVILSRVKGVYYPDGSYFLNDLVTAISHPVHSIDGGKTWQRCGVWE